MKKTSIVVLIGGVVLLASAALAAQPFGFREGQSVYIRAFHTIEHSTARRANLVPATAIVDSHLPAELRVSKDFEKRRVYNLVNKASTADFVFLVLIDDSAAEGLALAPDAFSRYQATFDIEAMREAAYARTTIGPLKIHNLGRLSDQLVRKFHEGEGRVAK